MVWRVTEKVKTARPDENMGVEGMVDIWPAEQIRRFAETQ